MVKRVFEMLDEDLLGNNRKIDTKENERILEK